MNPWTPALAGLMVAAALCSPVHAVTPGEKVDLLSDPEFKNFTLQLDEKNSFSLDKSVFSIQEGILRVSGEGFGYLRTNTPYKDYHLILEYKWGEHTWSKRADKARDGGVFVHCQSPDKGFKNIWPVGVEAQLIEGGTGNLSLLGKLDPVARAIMNRDANGRYAPEAAALIVSGEKVTSFANYRAADWTDVRGYRGKQDPEEIFGEWNRLEVICRGDAVEVRLNGKTVNKVSGLTVTEGFVAVQGEWAEWFARKWELWPLDQYKETWVAETKTTNTGSGAELLPRPLPLSPKEAMAAFQIDGPYEIQLIASEPLVNDPVDVVWDEKGRMFVAEMRDYPLPTEQGPLLSRIRLLKDTNHDGLPDQAVTWADQMDHVQSLLPVDGGLLATTRTQILILRDTNGDDVADEKTIVYQSNEPSHSQLQISCPRWGRDNWIYLNNGLNGAEIYPVLQPEHKTAIARRNIRIHPVTKEIQTVSGYGQFGAAIDDWGRRFACTNRNPTIYSIMPLAAVERNPFAALTQGHVDIAPFGGDSLVYPVNLSHTTAAAHLGTHTAACGLGVYQGHLMPEMTGDVFVCEPPGQLVTRAKLVKDGANLKAERVRQGKQTEFLRSSDEWFRPVNLRTGPDGALYVCDMYRRFIDHSRFFPDEFAKTHYMRAGFDHGRIYRIVPKGTKIAPFGFSSSDAGLIGGLSNPNGWARETAQRLIVEGKRKDLAPQVRPLLTGENALGRLHAFWTLQGLGLLTGNDILNALNDVRPEVVVNAIEALNPQVNQAEANARLIKLTRHADAAVRFAAVIALGGNETAPVTEALAATAIKDAGDPWMRKALLSSSEKRAGVEYLAVLNSPGFKDASRPERTAFLTEFGAAIAARGDVEEVKAVLAAIAAGGETGNWWQLAAVEGIAEGLRRHKGALKVNSLAGLLKSPPDGMSESAKTISAIVNHVSSIVTDRSAPVDRRVAALPLLLHLDSNEALARFTTLIEPNEVPAVRQAAFGIAGGLNRTKVADLLFARWSTLDPTSKTEALKLLPAQRLMEKMKAGEINPALMDPMSRWVHLRSSNKEVAALAKELWGQPTGDRGKVLDSYRPALELAGDVERGRVLFTNVCAVCHKVDGFGQDIGPDITDVRNKPAEALLSDILDPNRAVEARWTAYAVQTQDARTLMGLISAETADSVTLKGPGVNETLPRAQIKSLGEVGQSLMPVGMEGALDKQQMADLLAFLRKR